MPFDYKSLQKTMKEQFIETNFRQDSLDRIKTINGILEEYDMAGYDLSLRQLYYQLVARDLIENSQKSYKRMGTLVTKARKAGLIDWEMISDRNRATVYPNHWDDPAEIVRAAADQFAIDKWEGQENYVEVMVEKDALTGILEPVCRSLDIRFTANKGYPSVSLLYGIGKRLRRHTLAGKNVCILHLGDHDPSGIDMTRDLIEQLAMFADTPIEVYRLALNMDQIELLNPPKNPAKVTDSRYKNYVIEFGESAWELDAIEPRRLAAIVSNTVKSLRDETAWNDAVEREKAMRAELQEFVTTYKSNDNGNKR